jgi:hypothetical protein
VNAVIQGVLIGSGLSIFGQVITQLFKLKSIKIEKHHDRLDLIFKKRMEAYSEMNFKLYELDKAVGLKKIQEFEKLYLGITAYWGRVCVYMPPTVSMKILKVINYWLFAILCG